MKYYYAFQCHNFQRRACWVLSSILQQTIWPFKIIVDIACLRDNGKPSTEWVAQEFAARGLDVRLTHFENKDVFAKRGLVRNVQCKNAIANKADYVFFADADTLYQPEFFEILTDKLKAFGETIHKCIYSANKMHTIKEATNAAIEKSLGELPYIKNAFERALALPQMVIPRDQLKDGGAAGCMQVVSIRDLIGIGKGIYIPRKNNKDRHLFKAGQLARSDIFFRIRMGGSKRIRLPLQIHLQHTRDKELGYHTEEQR